MAKFRPTSDTSAPGWTSTAGTLAAAINEATADDAGFITSPALAESVDPYRFAIGPIAAGTVTKTVRAQRTGSVGDVRLVFFDAGGVEVGASAWQAVTPDWADYTLPVTTTATATQAEIQVKGAVAYSPLTLFAAGEQGVWYDPSDFSTLFQDSAGTVPVTATGQPVGRINDKSGRGNHATQATTASKPILQQDGNGKYYLAFDGVDDSMATAAVNFTGTDKMSVFAGAYWTSGTGIVAELSASGVYAGCFFVVAGQDRGTGWNSISTGSAAANALHEGYATASAPDLAVVTATHDISGDLSRVRRNGVSGVDGTLDKGAGNFTNNILYIGRRGGASVPFNGRVYQFIIRGALTDAAGITAAETFVNTKTAAY